jgi:hypothetical protein
MVLVIRKKRLRVYKKPTGRELVTLAEGRHPPHGPG